MFLRRFSTKFVRCRVADPAIAPEGRVICRQTARRVASRLSGSASQSVTLRSSASLRTGCPWTSSRARSDRMSIGRWHCMQGCSTCETKMTTPTVETFSCTGLRREYFRLTKELGWFPTNVSPRFKTIRYASNTLVFFCIPLRGLHGVRRVRRPSFRGDTSILSANWPRRFSI